MKRTLFSGIVLLVMAIAVAVAQSGAGTADDVNPAAPADGALRTVSYGLFPVESSGVTGYMNVSERVEGGTRLVVTLVGIQPGDLYLPVLFQGDCGPDRERVRALPPVGSMANDPFVSILDSNFTFDDLSEGNYFMYVFPGENEEGRAVACGEVGVGANR